MKNKELTHSRSPFDEEVNLRELLNRYLVHWKWFALSLFILLSVVYLMLRYTPKQFESKAKLLIKYEKAGVHSELSAFQDLGLFEGMSGYNNLYNEKEILRSRTLIERVVKKLGLNVTYSSIGTKTGIERKEYYTNAPVKLVFIDSDSMFYNRACEFHLEIINGEKYRIVDHPDFGSDLHSFGSTIDCKPGKIRIEKTKYLQNKNAELEIGISITPIPYVINYYQSSLMIDPISEDVDILELKLRGPVVQKNNDFLDQLIQEHTDQTIADQNKVYRSTTEFINDRIAALSGELSEVEVSGESYKTQHDFSNILMSEKSLYDRALINEKKLIDTEIQLELISFLHDYLIEHPKNDRLLPSNLGFEDISINESTQQFNKVLLERDRLKTHSSSKNPQIIRLETELESIKAGLMESLNNFETSLKLGVEKLKRLDSQLQGEIANLPKHERIMRSIDRQQQLKESLYLYLLQKREENEIASAVTEGNSKIIDPSFSNGTPVNPNKKIYYATALLFGLLIPFSIIYLRHILDNKVNSKSDLDKFQLPHLGNIPEIKTGEKIVISKENNSPEAESFRILRTNSSFLLPSGKSKGSVITITSTTAKEGKSFIALNLATSYALTGQKTIVVGLDLRAPKLLEYYNLPSTKGVSDYIVHPDIDIQKLIIPSPNVEHLSILPSGTTPPNPSEIIMREELSYLFDQLRSQFDIIIVDTAPVGLVTDTLLINHLSDATLFVVRANSIDKKMLAYPKELMETKKLTNLAVVLNATKKENAFGYGGYSYVGYGIQNEERRSWISMIFNRGRS